MNRNYGGDAFIDIEINRKTTRKIITKSCNGKISKVVSRAMEPTGTATITISMADGEWEVLEQLPCWAEVEEYVNNIGISKE